MYWLRTLVDRTNLTMHSFTSQIHCCVSQCFGSGSRLNLDSIWILIPIRNPDPDPEGQKCPTKLVKSQEISCFKVLDFLFWGLISKLQFWSKKSFFSAVNYFHFLVKTLDPGWIRIGIQPKMLDPDPESMNPNPKHWCWKIWNLFHEHLKQNSAHLLAYV
jgi:hypothetical protein